MKKFWWEKDLVCNRCGKTKSQRLKEPPMDTGINHPQYRYTTSFYTSFDGNNVLCPECHKERMLEDCINAITNKEKRNVK